MIRTLIVDDAPLVRQGVRLLLRDEADIDIVGEAADGPEAVEAIRNLQPDLVFLDIRMPGFDGFEVLNRSTGFRPEAVVFVTSYDEYALQAFDVRACHYLLKPMDPVRFHEALARVRQTFASRKTNGPVLPDTVRPVAAEGSAGKTSLFRFCVRDRERYVMVKAEDVDWIAAMGEYVKLHSRGKAFLIHAAISDLEERLDTTRFKRIHRSTIVNLDRITEMRPRSHGDCDVVLQSGEILRMSRSYRDQIFMAE